MKIKNKIIEFVKKRRCMTAAMVLAVLSAVMIPPDTEYIGYIDFRTLAILFCLMTVMAGLQKLGIFSQGCQDIIAAYPQCDCAGRNSGIAVLLFQHVDHE